VMARSVAKALAAPAQIVTERPRPKGARGET
jgi:hypothetical protein